VIVGDVFEGLDNVCCYGSDEIYVQYSGTSSNVGGINTQINISK